MTLPTITMPEALPDWLLAPHDMELGTPYTRIGVTTGEPRLRRVSTGTTQRLRAELVLVPTLSPVFNAWYETELEAGVLPFAARTVSPLGLREWWRAFFVTPPSWTAIAAGGGPLWRVTAELKLEGLASATAPA